MKENELYVVQLQAKIEGLEESRDELKCSEVRINERIQELEQEISDLV